MVFYTIAVICLYKESNPDVEVTVSLNTDSQPLIEMVRKQTVLEGIRFVERRPELAGDKVAKVDVIRDTYRSLGKDFDIVVDLDITSPLRGVNDIENIIDIYKSNESYDLVASVVPARRSPYFNMVEKRDGYYKKICESVYTTRQEAPESYELNASIYAYNPVFLDTDITDTILDHRCGISVMKDYLVLDIDSEEDFKMMEVLHRYYVETDDSVRMVFETARNIST